MSIQDIVLSIFVNDNDKDFMIGKISLSMNRFRDLIPFELNIHYLLKEKKTGLLYCTQLPIYQDNVFDLLNNDSIESVYKYDKEVLSKMHYSTTVTSAFSLIESLINTDKSIFESFENHICENVFPFLKNKKENNFMTNLINEILFPYRMNLSFPYNDLSLLDLKISINQKLYQSLLKETNPVKQVQHFLPKANKQTIVVLRNMFNHPFDDSDGLFNQSKNIDFVFMNLFTTTERMNEFIKSILFVSDETNQSIEYIFKKEDSYHKKIYDFIENDLIKFFSSRKLMEEFLIKQMYSYTEEVFEESSFLKEEEEEEEEHEDDEFEYYSNYKKTNFEQLIDDLEELKFIFNRFKENENHFKVSTEKNDMARYSLMQNIYNQKFSNLQELHDEIAILNSRNSIDEFKEYENSQLKETELYLNDYSLVEISNSTTLKEVGIRMNHCVYSYESKIIKKESFIFIIKNTLTNKFEICLEYDVLSNSIVQAKGRKNSIVKNKEILSLVELFKDKNNLKINTNDLPLRMNN